MAQKLVKGQEVTIEDCMAEVQAELDEGLEGEVYMTVE